MLPQSSCHLLQWAQYKRHTSWTHSGEEAEVLVKQCPCARYHEAVACALPIPKLPRYCHCSPKHGAWHAHILLYQLCGLSQGIEPTYSSTEYLCITTVFRFLLTNLLCLFGHRAVYITPPSSAMITGNMTGNSLSESNFLKGRELIYADEDC